MAQISSRSVKHVVRCSAVLLRSFSRCNAYTQRVMERSRLADNFTESKACEHDGTTHYGFQRVTEREKARRVHAVFENVAEKYDVMNDAMSLGVHRFWKDTFMGHLAPCPGTNLLDVAGGTGDIAFRFVRYVNSQYTEAERLEVQMMGFENPLAEEAPDDEAQKILDSVGPNKSSVTVCDINGAMLNVGKQRQQQTMSESPTTTMHWVKGDAESLPFSDSTYDAYTIAFGIRNCTHIDKVLLEAHRVLKPGGRFLCLEFSHVNNFFLRRVYDEYSFQVIPVLGQIIAQDWKSYQYLVESIRKFPKQDQFKDMIRKAGFKMVQYENLSLGIVAIHSAFKL